MQALPLRVGAVECSMLQTRATCPALGMPRPTVQRQTVMIPSSAMAAQRSQRGMASPPHSRRQFWVEAFLFL